MQYQNPFKPTAGKMPPVLVGREKVTDDFLEGLANGEKLRARLMRITGPRGSGKTVLLSETLPRCGRRGLACGQRFGKRRPSGA